MTAQRPYTEKEVEEEEAVVKHSNVKHYYSRRFQIRLFWEVFHELPIEEKKKFLLFLTGSDRIPIDGMKEVRVSS